MVLVSSAAIALAGCSELTSGSSSGTASSPAKPGDAGGGKASSGSGVYAVTFGVKNNAGRLGAVQFTAKPNGGGTWQGEGANVACRSAAGPSMHACNEQSGSVLSCGFIDTNGIRTPGDLVTCTFESSKAVAAGDFAIHVVDSTDTATKPVKADVVVTRVTGR